MLRSQVVVGRQDQITDFCIVGRRADLDNAGECVECLGRVLDLAAFFTLQSSSTASFTSIVQGDGVEERNCWRHSDGHCSLAHTRWGWLQERMQQRGRRCIAVASPAGPVQVCGRLGILLVRRGDCLCAMMQCQTSLELFLFDPV